MSGGHNRFPLGIHGSADFHPPIPPAASSFDPQLFLTQFLDQLGGDPEAQLGKAVLDELTALSKENDPELFWEAALRLAHRLERQDRIEASLALLQGISAGVEGNFTDLQHAADRRVNVLLGQGEFGDRFEFMLRRVTHELSDPWAITAFGAGSLAFRAAKLGALSRLWTGSARGYLPGRVAAELIASGAGLGAEAPIFLLTSKLGHQIGGQGQDWRGETLAREIAGVGITLLCLRGVGSLGEKSVKNHYFGKAGQTVVPQAAMFSGILLANRVEELLKLKPESNGSTFLADGLATYLQFAAGGRLAEETLGAGFRSWQRRLDWQAASLGGRGGNWGPVLPALAGAGAGPRLGRNFPSILDLRSKPLMSENHGDGDGSQGPAGRRLRLVKSTGDAPGGKGPQEPSPQEPKLEGQQILDLSLARMLRSKPMDEKERQFRAEVDAVMLGSASEIRRQTLEREIISKLPVLRREELTRNLQNLHPELLDLFGSAARDMPWQAMAQAFVEMNLMRSSPGELKAPSSFEEPSQYYREVLAEELRLDHRRLFGISLPGVPEVLNTAVSRLSGPSVQLLGHWTQGPGTRLLMGQRLGLPGLPAEPEILQAYQKWLDRPPESE